MKDCNACGSEKPNSEFYKGHARCKECYKAVVKGYRERNAEKVREYEIARSNLPHRVRLRSEYAKTDKGKIASAKAKKKWAKSNPIKRAANIIVGNAVRDGRLSRPSACEECSSEQSGLHGHHDDYALPLIVRWLCPGCHNKWHKNNGEGKNAF